MLKQILKKLAALLPTLLIASIILFILINILPGDVVSAMMQEGTSAEMAERQREALGLNDPLYIQYFHWIGRLLHGNLGNSMVSNTPVLQRLTDRFPVTLELVFLSLIIATIIAIPTGVLSAVRSGTAVDSASRVVAIIGVSMPSFWIGTLFVLLFSVKLKLLPASGFVSFFEDPLQNMRYMLIPAFCIGFGYAGSLMRQTRSALLEVLGQEYVSTARAKGLKESVVIWKHAFRNAAIPVMTVLAMHIGRLIGGSVVVETIFALPGMGKAIIDGIFQRDYTLVMGFVMVIIVFVVCLNTLVDMLYVVVDPRLYRSVGNDRR